MLFLMTYDYDHLTSELLLLYCVLYILIYRSFKMLLHTFWWKIMVTRKYVELVRWQMKFFICIIIDFSRRVQENAAYCHNTFRSTYAFLSEILYNINFLCLTLSCFMYEIPGFFSSVINKYTYNVHVIFKQCSC